jgi:hypothetical protein
LCPPFNIVSGFSPETCGTFEALVLFSHLLLKVCELNHKQICYTIKNGLSRLKIEKEGFLAADKKGEGF